MKSPIYAVIGIFIARAACAVIKPYECPESDGVYLIPESQCEKFALCKNGQLNIYMCEPGLKFDIAQTKCRVAETVVCSDDVNYLSTRRARREASDYGYDEDGGDILPETEPFSANVNVYSYDYYGPDTAVFAPAAPAPAPAAPPKKKSKTIKVFQKTETDGHYKVNQDANTHNDSNVEIEVTLSHPSGHGSELARKSSHHEINEENIKYEHDRDYEHVEVIPVKKSVPLFPSIDSILGRRPVMNFPRFRRPSIG